MTYHGLEGQLCAAVVGFDYQRTMVAAAAALLGLFTSTAPQGVITSTPPQRPRPHTPHLKQGQQQGQQQQSQLQQPQQPPLQPHCLLVGLGAGSCAAALHVYGAAARLRVTAIELDL